MALSLVGTMSLGFLSPLALSVAAQLSASLAAEIAALADLTINLGITPPTFAFSIAALAELEINLTSAISQGIVSVDFQALAMIDTILSISLELAFPLSFRALLEGQGGLFAYAWDGVGQSFGAEVSGLLTNWADGSSGNDPANALIVATTLPSVWDNVTTIFDVIPPSPPAGVTYIASGNLAILAGLFLEATGATISDLEARLSGAIALAAKLAIQLPSFAFSVFLIGELLAHIAVLITTGLPDFTFQIEAILKAIASITAKIELLAKLVTALTGAGAYVYTYAGPGNQLGAAITSSIAGGWPDGASNTSHANALILGSVTPAAWSSVSNFFGGIYAKTFVQTQRTVAAFSVIA